MISVGWRASANCGTPKSNLAESRPARQRAAGGPPLLVALGVQRPGAEHREGSAADQHQVGGSPKRHVLTEDPVPDVIERERRERAGAADRDHQRADRGVPPGCDLVRGPRRLVRQGEPEHAGEQHAEESGEDEVVGRIGEWTRVAALVDVQGDVPVHPEDRDQQGEREEGAGQRGPARELGDPL
jgi:hypothetical protein